MGKATVGYKVILFLLFFIFFHRFLIQTGAPSAAKYILDILNTFECFHGKYDVTRTPVALHISKRVLTLPLYADLALEDVDRICDIILNCKY